nr:hypothetical protein [Heyndrickxia oleronia]
MKFINSEMTNTISAIYNLCKSIERLESEYNSDDHIELAQKIISIIIKKGEI